MVDAEDLPFGQRLAHGQVDGAVGGQVVAKRFLQHHPRARAVEVGRRDLLDHLREELRRGGHIHQHGVGVALLQKVGQLGVVARLRQIHAQVIQQRGEPLEFLGRGPFGTFHGLEARLNQLAVLVVVEIVARHADDAPALGQAAMTEGLEQGRHQLAPGQVAGAAEQNEIEAHG